MTILLSDRTMSSHCTILLTNVPSEINYSFLLKKYVASRISSEISKKLEFISGYSNKIKNNSPLKYTSFINSDFKWNLKAISQDYLLAYLK